MRMSQKVRPNKSGRVINRVEFRIETGFPEISYRKEHNMKFSTLCPPSSSVKDLPSSTSVASWTVRLLLYEKEEQLTEWPILAGKLDCGALAFVLTQPD